jgi:hypothetical protein
MTTNVDPARFRPVGPSIDQDVDAAALPATTDRDLRRLAEERLADFVSGQSQPSPEYGPCDVVPHPALFHTESRDTQAIDLHDVQQSGFADCYLLSPLAGLTRTAEGRALIQNAITENRNGRGEVVSYTVTLHKPQMNALGTKTFQPVKVTVNASFECGHAEPRVQNGSAEIWPLVVEAAYAKLAGGYPAIQGGYPGVALEVLTGRPVEHIPVGWPAGYLTKTLKADLAAGKIVVFGTQTLDPVACPNSKAKHPEGQPAAYNLYSRHAYLAVGTATRDGKEYVLLHNPWNRDEPDPVPIEDVAKYFQSIDVGSAK